MNNTRHFIDPVTLRTVWTHGESAELSDSDRLEARESVVAAPTRWPTTALGLVALMMVSLALV